MIVLIKQKWMNKLNKLNKFILLFLVSLTLTACGGGSSNTTDNTSEPANNNATSDAEESSQDGNTIAGNTTTNEENSSNQDNNSNASDTTTDGESTTQDNNTNPDNTTTTDNENTDNQATQNTKPIANKITINGTEDIVSNITLLASDANNDTLSYTIVNQPQHGSISLTNNIATYTPTANYVGSDSFTFKANDGSLDSNTATVAITLTPVNDAPTISHNHTAQTDEDQPVEITLVADDDIDNDSLSYVIVSQPANGTVTLKETNGVTKAIYTPKADYQGNDSFRFKVNDGTQDSNTVTVTITINPSNDAPTISHNHTAQTDEDQPVEITLVADDADNDSLRYDIVSNPSNGTITLTTANGVTKATYTPKTDYQGEDSFRFKVNDGVEDSNTATVTITVNPVNDAPIANNGNATTDKNTPKAITLTANDVDTDNATLTYVIETQPENGSVTVDGTTATYTSSADYVGSDSFSFSATDGDAISNIATINLTVNDVQQTMKILPLGDSITHAHVSQLSYRYFLWKLLLDQGSDFDFIGSRTTRYGSGNKVAQPDYLGQSFDRDHEGLSGIRADQVLNNLDGLLQNYTPDVVLIHLGTNDIFQGQSTSSTVNELEGIIGKLRNDNADVTLFLAKIIPAASARNGVIDLNNQLDDLANRLSTSNSPVIIVDMFSNFDTNSDTYDGTHPNQQGEQKMAQRWFDAMINNGIF